MSTFVDMMTEAAFPAQLATRGEAVTYHPSGAANVSIDEALFAVDSATREEGERGGNDARTGRLHIDKADVASPSRVDQVTIRSVKWDVVTIDDLDYAWRLNVRRSVAIERAAARFRQPLA